MARVRDIWNGIFRRQGQDSPADGGLLQPAETGPDEAEITVDLSRPGNGAQFSVRCDITFIHTDEHIG